MASRNYLWFDMDGTIYDLYKIPAWLDALKEHDMTIYSATDMGRKSLPRIREAVRALQEQGWQVGIITWGPMDATNRDWFECKKYKLQWLRECFP